ncbi:MAG: phosphoribosylformimino-5-aminoimidazole carboxamide ribotide isomerase [Lachnospiraceae bacterium]|nr:phosphoribosylformimino-5-aminoimidazole carboxamide ribotide isomerase [Lachnospiraceae bacterium]
MQFRPCIDIHNGAVKQIVGSSLRDDNSSAAENFVSESSAAYYADLYKKYGFAGGHVINLNSRTSDMYELSRRAAIEALSAYPGGMQYGGGVTDENAASFLEAGASHVIVTSYVFSDGKLNYVNLDRLLKEVGKDRLVLDLSCRKRGDKYFVVTDRWQRFTELEVNIKLFQKLAGACDEFLVHGVDVEGKRAGIDEELVSLLSEADAVITYAGGVRSLEDMELIRLKGRSRINATIGSALNIFGGEILLDDIYRFNLL